MTVQECPEKVLEKHNFSDCPGTVEFRLKCPGKVLGLLWSMEFGFLWQSSNDQSAISVHVFCIIQVLEKLEF